LNRFGVENKINEKIKYVNKRKNKARIEIECANEKKRKIANIKIKESE